MEAVRRKEVAGEWARETKLMDDLAQRGAIARATEGLPGFIPQDRPALIQSNPLEEISVQSMRKWACGAAGGIVNGVLDALSASPYFEPMVKTIYGNAFQIRENED